MSGGRVQRLVRPGRSRAHATTQPPDHGQPHLRASSRLRGRPRRQGFAGRRGRVPEARDGEPRGRAAEPPERVGGPRCHRRPNDSAQRRRKPPAGPRNWLMSRRPLQRLVRPGRSRPHRSRATTGLGPTLPPCAMPLRGRPRRQGFAGLGAACRRRGTAARGPRRPNYLSASAALGAGKAERPSSAAAETTYRAVQPADESPSAAAPGSAGATRDAPEPRDRLPRPDPTARFVRLRGRPRHRASRAVGAAGRRRVTASVGAAPPSHPYAAALGAAGAERLSSAAAATTDRAVEPPHESPSAAAPGSAGARPGHTPRHNRLARPNPTSALRAPSRPPAPTRFGGPRGRGPEARDREPRGRADRPPSCAAGCRCRGRPNDSAQRRRQPRTGPCNRLLIRRPLQRLVRPGRPRPHAAARWPDPAQPHLYASFAFAAARAYTPSPAVEAAGRQARDGERRGRAAEPPERSGGPRCR